jgi:DGQHR domain-containing protein
VTRNSKFLERHALRVVQDPAHPVYLFVLSPEDLLDIAEVSRMTRDDDGDLSGYQRPEVRRHVRNITAYLDSNQGRVLFPHAPILSLPSTVRFRRARTPGSRGELGESGTLVIPRPTKGEAKPGWIVDGQQRVLALSRSTSRAFPVPVCAFVADDVRTQREQFLLINSAKPLPRGLISELLPDVEVVLPSDLSVRRAPSALCDALNRDRSSPFFGLIKRSSMERAQRKKAIVSDTTLIKVFEESFSSPFGALFPYRNIATGQTDYERIQQLLNLYWSAVRDTFPEAWGLPPTSSRLMHSAGLRAMGRLMDRVMSSPDLDDRRLPQRLRRDLARLKPHCAWTEGKWKGLGGVKWNEIQNVGAHVRMLSEHIQRSYLSGPNWQ